MNSHKVCVVVCTAAVLGAACGAQTPVSRPSAPSQSIYVAPPVIPNSLTADLSEPAAPDTYLLGAGDLLDVFVMQMPDMTRQIRIDRAGNIRMPLSPQSFRAAGLTAPQLAQQVRLGLIADGLARNPQVEVVVRQVESKPVVVSGAVKSPVTLQLVKPLSLVEVLSRAGGLAETAGTQVLVSVTSADGVANTQTYSTAPQAGPSELESVYLHGGEVVRVPPAEYVYAVGALSRPGAFPVTEGQSLTVLRTLSLAGGIKEHADAKHAVILHGQGTANESATRINLDGLLQHKVADLGLRPGDVLYVPTNQRSVLLVQLATYAAQAATIALGYSVGH